MFATAHVFQDVAAMIIRNPADGIATVSVAAPGMVGTIAGVNVRGVGIGVDMCPAANCDPDRPGLNSLLLTRHSIERGGTCKEAVNAIKEARRGVSWLYIVADGATDEACVVEAGATTTAMDVLRYVDDWVVNTLKAANPDFENLLKTPSAPFLDGLMARGKDYVCPQAFQALNPALIGAFGKRSLSYAYHYNPQDFSTDGFLDPTWKGRNCPGSGLLD